MICKNCFELINKSTTPKSKLVWECELCLDEHCRHTETCRHSDPHPQRTKLMEFTREVSIDQPNFEEIVILAIHLADEIRKAKTYEDAYIIMSEFVVSQVTNGIDMFAEALADNLLEQFNQHDNSITRDSLIEEFKSHVRDEGGDPSNLTPRVYPYAIPGELVAQYVSRQRSHIRFMHRIIAASYPSIAKVINNSRKREMNGSERPARLNPTT
jgi:hypothetical protein